ncbi:MAG: DUF350 domain-containing protein [Syntrophobacteraceae bacterium]|nr:DUF350 domain-containing protein [Syntrophobacteraceae bacterium]
MSLAASVNGLAYLLTSLVLFLLGKVVFDLLNRQFSLKEELVERDNLAVAISVAGYFIGLTMALGGVLAGESVSLKQDVIDITRYGIVAIVLLNLSYWINDWCILMRSNIGQELVRDQNCGVGLISGANHVAMGLILYGLLSGEGGGLLTVAVFWVLSQLALILAAKLYDFLSPYDVQEALARDNAAVGAAYAGMLLGIGNVIRFAVQGNFSGWVPSLTSFGLVVMSGLMALPVLRWITDRLILPGRRLNEELIRQDRPNIGAGVIEGTVYVCMSYLIGWCIQ